MSGSVRPKRTDVETIEFRESSLRTNTEIFAFATNHYDRQTCLSIAWSTYRWIAPVEPMESTKTVIPDASTPILFRLSSSISGDRSDSGVKYLPGSFPKKRGRSQASI